MEQIPEQKRIQLHCEATRKVLAKADEQGIWLWCRACHREHLISWSNISLPKHVAESAFDRNALTQT
jgi:hypothetical protein